MMKIFKKISIYLVIIISVMFINSLNVYAVDGVGEDNVDVTTTTSVLDYDYDSYDYVIDKYDVNIIVNENNTFDITETIMVDFNKISHGIKINIPLINRIKRKDGTRTTNRVQIDNVTVDREFSTRKENGNYIIQIGSPSETVIGKETYVIKYTYNVGEDPIKNYDEVYFDVIRDEWDTLIKNVTFKISMPKKFDSKKLEFLSDDELLTNDKIKYNIKNNTIEGNYIGTLYYDGFTINLKLPEGYFKNASLKPSVQAYLMIIIPVMCLLITFILWYFFNYKKRVIESVGFYPPDGFNSLEIGFLYKGYADKKDVTSLLIYLANKGYLKISEIEEKALFSKKKGFKITKLKDYDGDNLYERVFFKGLFRFGNKVTSSDLQGSFYSTTLEILSDINSDENKSKIIKKNIILKVILAILFFISSFATLVLPIFEYTNGFLMVKIISVYAFTIPLIFIAFISKLKLVRFIILVFLLCIVQLNLELDGVMTVLKLFDVSLIYVIGMIIGLISILFISYLYNQKQRTDFGNEMLYKIKGFKNYLVTVEKERLEDNVAKDPEYFYSILPYTYVLGVSNKWIKNFETISIQNPSWCDTMNSLGFINDTFNTTYSMVSYSGSFGGSDGSSSSGESSSGESSSGGGGEGSGGGGGSSW